MPKIEYEGQTYEATEEEVPDGDAAVDFLKMYSERAAGADVEVDVRDGEKIYRVTARAGGKGDGLIEMLSALEQAKQFVQPAIAMAEKMEGMEPTTMLLERDRIRKAYEEGKTEFESMDEIRTAVRKADAIPARNVPTGF
jgi:hypothetical protein